MQYLGGKAKVAKHILPIILKNRKENQLYVEPFCGGCNVIDRVTGPRLAMDSNEYLIAMWKALQNGWEPPSNITKEFYYEVKNNSDEYSKELVAFVALPCSFSGKWFGGYASNSEGRNYADVAKRSFEKQILKLQNVEFCYGDYTTVEFSESSVVYCDPPYADTTKYTDNFDHEKFWHWVRKISKDHQVFISEYNAPKDFECLWEKEHKITTNKNKKEIRVERLFRYSGCT